MDIIEIAKNYMGIWNAGSESLLDKYADKNLSVDYSHFDKTYNGIEEYKSILKMTYDFFPDLRIKLEKLILARNENSVTIKWNYSGTHENGNLFGVRASGNKITVGGITILECENGLVIKEYGIVDNLSLMNQIGAVDS